jgi:hypothetical protein
MTIKWMEQPCQQQQGAGGIIQQRAAVLLTAAQDTSIYDYMTDAQRDSVDDIAAKAPADRTQADINCLLDCLQVARC